MTDTMHPWVARFDRLAEQYPNDNDSTSEARYGVEEEGCRWLLIERSTIDGSHYLTTHPDADAAAAYVSGQEYPEDWTEEAAYDLYSGTAYYPERTTRFVPYPGDSPKHDR